MSQQAAPPPAGDPYNLGRFLAAQDEVWADVVAELTAGCKATHWMWFVFPQLKGLGSSGTAKFFGLGSLGEAQAYLAHPVLGPRLIEATQLVAMHRGQALRRIFGTPDDLKFRSSMTLFARAAGEGSVFARALDDLCGGIADERTLALITG